MRKAIARSVLLVLALVAFSSPARADYIPIGQLQWLDLLGDITGVASDGQFSIINQTGVNSTNDFPVTTLLTFNDISLDVADDNFGPRTLTLADFTDSGLTLDSNDFFLNPTLAELIGSIIPVGLVNLSSLTNPAWNGTWNILTGTLYPVPVFLDFLPNDAGSPLFSDTAIIYVEAVRAPVPEPMTLTLFGAGLVGVMVRRRVRARG